MKKAEKDAVCALIAGWEFEQNGSSSEAAARARCAVDVMTALQITQEHMVFYRAWEIAKLVGDDTDEFLDALCDAVDADYRGVLDALDNGLAGFRSFMVASGSTGGDGR